MRRMKKSQQREHARRRAPELARTGKFLSWHGIEVHLRFEEDCPEARDALDNERIRDELDRLCQEARVNA